MKTRITTITTIFCLVIFFTGCSKKDEAQSTTKLKLEQTQISVIAGKTESLTITPSMDGCTFESENSLIASVSSQGIIRGSIVGETNIQVTNKTNNFSSKCKVTVTPQYQMYREPYLNFGVSVSQIKSYETRKLINETATAIGYEGENSRVTLVLYILENSKLKSVGVLIPHSSYNMELLANFMKERYVVNVYDEDILFFSADKNIGGGIAVYYNSGKYYYQVIYFEFDNAAATATYFPSKSKNNMIMDRVREQFESVKADFKIN